MPYPTNQIMKQSINYNFFFRIKKKLMKNDQRIDNTKKPVMARYVSGIIDV